MSWFLLNRNLTPLEPYDWKLSRTVLRGERGSNAPDLPGKAIASPLMAEYIKFMYKTARKFWASVGVVTQEIQDIIGSEIVKEAIINNSDVVMLLDQSKFKERFDNIKAILGLTETYCKKIFTINRLENKEGRSFFREVFIRRVRRGGTEGVLHDLYDRTGRERSIEALQSGTEMQPPSGHGSLLPGLETVRHREVAAFCAESEQGRQGAEPERKTILKTYYHARRKIHQRVLEIQ